jgi:hypothetical protein
MPPSSITFESLWEAGEEEARSRVFGQLWTCKVAEAHPKGSGVVESLAAAVV